MRIATQYGFSLEANPKSYFAQYLQQNGSYEEPDSQLIRSLIRPGDFCIDAGAHVGYFSCLMAKAGARVLAIEPNPMHYAALEENTRGLNIATSHMALSDRNSDSSVPFFLPSEFDDGWGSLCAADKGDRSRPTEVWSTRLDSLLGIEKLFSGPRIRLMKMDVEGAEVPSLRGAGERLQDIEYVLIECIDIPSRVSAFGSTVEGINAIFAGWQVRQHRAGHWRTVDKAVSNGENFLFVNSKAGR